jgi:hypothetical protein
VVEEDKELSRREITANGTARAELIPTHSRSLENEVVPADVVETYVPITKGGRLLGVFELYHNVAKGRKDLNRLIYRSYGTLFVMALGLLVLVLASSFQAHRSMQKHNKTNDRQYPRSQPSVRRRSRRPGRAAPRPRPGLRRGARIV